MPCTSSCVLLLLRQTCLASRATFLLSAVWRPEDKQAGGRAAAHSGDPEPPFRGVCASWERVGLQDEGPWWMALGILPRLCHPPAAQVGGSLQRLLVVPGLGPREPALEVSSRHQLWCLA